MLPQIDKTQPFDENENIEQSSSNVDLHVFSIRKYLLILIFIQWAICVGTLGIGIYFILFDNTADVSSEIQSLLPVMGIALYYTFGLLVAYKQHRVGLLIFASIGVILFILVFILVAYMILAIAVLGIGFGNTNQAYEFIVFIGILFAMIAAVAILTLKFSFDLVKSIKTHAYSTV